MTELSIVPECYVDTKIAEIISQAKRKYNHQHGCGDVANQLKNKLKDLPALGIIDEDKNKGPVAKYFTEFELLLEENGLILKKHIQRQHYLILICPEIENWLLNNAADINIGPLNFSLPAQLAGLKKLTKSQDIDKNLGFYQFIKELMKNEAPGIMTLSNWLDSFKRNGSPV